MARRLLAIATLASVSPPTWAEVGTPNQSVSDVTSRHEVYVGFTDRDKYASTSTTEAIVVSLAARVAVLEWLQIVGRMNVARVYEEGSSYDDDDDIAVTATGNARLGVALKDRSRGMHSQTTSAVEFLLSFPTAQGAGVANGAARLASDLTYADDSDAFIPNGFGGSVEGIHHVEFGRWFVQVQAGVHFIDGDAPGEYSWNDSRLFLRATIAAGSRFGPVSVGADLATLGQPQTSDEARNTVMGHLAVMGALGPGRIGVQLGRVLDADTTYSTGSTVTFRMGLRL